MPVPGSARSSTKAASDSAIFSPALSIIVGIQIMVWRQDSGSHCFR
jgi:hypothetical protein